MASAVTVVDRIGVGGQISTAERIENFPGFPQGIAGHELGPLLHEQAEAAGAEFMLDTVEAIEIAGEQRILRGASEMLRARAVIIAAGSALRPLGFPGRGAIPRARRFALRLLRRSLVRRPGGLRRRRRRFGARRGAGAGRACSPGDGLSPRRPTARANGARGPGCRHRQYRDCAANHGRGDHGHRYGLRRAPARKRYRKAARPRRPTASSSMSGSSPTRPSCAACWRSTRPATSRPTS